MSSSRDRRRPRSPRLQSLIDKCAKASSAATEAQRALDQYCEAAYGAAPSDVDADSILDSVYGYSGECAGMSATLFDETMRGHIPPSPPSPTSGREGDD